MRIPPKADIELRNSLRDIHQEINNLKKKSPLGTRRESTPEIKPPEIKPEPKPKTEVETFRDSLVKGNLRVDGDITFGGLNGPEIGGLVGEANHGTDSTSQRVVQVNGSLAVLNALSAETVRCRNLNAYGTLNLVIPSCRVFNTADQSISNATNTDLTFNSEEFDNFDMHSTSSNTDRITIPTAGVYAYGAQVRWASNTTGVRFLFITLNDPSPVAAGAILTEDDKLAATLAQPFQGVYGIGLFAAGDILRAAVHQTSGGSLNVEGTGTGGPYSCHFWCYKISY